MKPHSASSWNCSAVYLLATAAYFSPGTAVTTAASLVLVIYVGLEFRRIPHGQIAAGTAMIVIGLGVAAIEGDGWDALRAGLRRTQMFFLLFAAVTWLRFPAGNSPSLRNAQERAMSQRPGRRLAILALAAHVLGAVLNLAGISLMSGVIREADDPALRRRLTRAVMQGFTAASCWTPFFIAMTVVLSVIPGLRWSDVAPIGFLAALLLTTLGWAMDRVCHRGRPAAPGALAATPRGSLDWRAASIPPTLFAAVIFLVEGFDLPIPIALAVVAPVYGSVWFSMQTARRKDPAEAVGELSRFVFHALPSLRSETFLFLGANILGAGVAAALPPEAMKAAIESVDFPAFVSVGLVMFGILACGAAGLHPVIVVVLVGEVLPPSVLGVKPVILGAALLSMWGLGAIVSPFSGTTLYLARAAQSPVWKVAWVWNGPYAILGTALAAALMGVAGVIGFG